MVGILLFHQPESNNLLHSSHELTNCYLQVNRGSSEIVNYSKCLIECEEASQQH